MQHNNDIIDPSEVFLGEDGNAIDPKDLLNGLADPMGGEPGNTGSDPANGGGQTDPSGQTAGGTEPSGQQQNKGDQGDDLSNYANPAEYAMKWLGYETDEVDFGEGPVKLSELSPEQQTDVLLTQLQTVVDSYENEISRLQTGIPQLQDPFQQQVFEYLRQNGDPKKLAEYILQNDPASLANTLPADQLVKKHLAETMGLEGDELEAEVNFLKDSNKLDAYAERIKKLYGQKGMDISGLNAEQQAALQAKEQSAIEDFRQQTADISNYAATVKDVSGIPVSKDVTDYVMQKIIPPSHNEDSEFIKTLDNPQKLYRLAFLDSYFEDIVDNLKQTYFEMGKKSVTPASQALSKEPIRVQSFRNASKPNSTAIGRDGKVDLDKIANSEITI